MKLVLTLRAPLLPVPAGTRLERRDRVVAREIDRLAVRDDRVVGAAVLWKFELAGLYVDAEGRPRVEVRPVGDPAHHGHPARDAAAVPGGPARIAGARVERVEGAVVGADVDRRAETADVHDRRR